MLAQLTTTLSEFSWKTSNCLGDSKLLNVVDKISCVSAATSLYPVPFCWVICYDVCSYQVIGLDTLHSES